MLILVPITLAIAVIFANRYFIGTLLRKLKGKKFDRTISNFQPTVTAVIPCFNEGPRIKLAIRSILDQNYPAEKLEVIVIDDCSQDSSYEDALSMVKLSPGRVRVFRNTQNLGKRLGIVEAVKLSQAEMILSLDSDTVAHADAVGNLTCRFYTPKIAAVGGEVLVENANSSWITRMQAIRFHLAYHYLKDLERAFHSVMCLSGCLTMYRRDVLISIEPALLDRSLFGVQLKYGEDRYLTRQIIKAGFETFNTCDATCRTLSPETMSSYFSQQLRWKRSIIVDFLGSLTHIWRVHPLVGLQYLSVALLVIVYPVIIIESVRSGFFIAFALAHLGVLSAIGLVYWVGTRKLPPTVRVHPLSILPMAVVLPTLYLVLTPLALMTLDSSNWETRVAQN